jgi:hypothetical protein
VKGNGLGSRVQVRADAVGCVSLAGTQLLVEAARVSGLSAALSQQLAPWRRPTAVHDPGKVVLDLVTMLAVGGDCPADVALLRTGSGLFGPIASPATISRLVDTLAAAGDQGLTALRTARATARARVQAMAGGPGGDEVVVDIDATLVDAHSEKETAAPTYKRGFGFHPLLAYADHGPGGTGEALAGINRRGNANAGTAADHLAMLDLIQAQLTEGERERLVIRTDTAACTHAFLDELVSRGIGYTVGFYARADVAAAIETLPASAWIPAIDADGVVRDGAWVAELTDLLSLGGWPAGMRVIARKERPHPGAQLRLTDVDGHRITCFATNHAGGDLTALELRHRRRARCEDRIRAAKDTGLRNLPYRDAASNQLWVELVLLAQDLTAWTQTLALDGEHAVAEPKRLRLLLFGIAARLIRTGRRVILDLDKSWPHAATVVDAITRLRALPVPG